MKISKFISKYNYPKRKNREGQIKKKRSVDRVEKKINYEEMRRK